MPLFYPRSYDDIEAAMVGFARIYDCTRCKRGGRAHVSFPLGIHRVGQMIARASDSGSAEHSTVSTEQEARSSPRASARLARCKPPEVMTPLAELPKTRATIERNAKRAKLARQWGAQVRDTFGMTEAGMMGAEDGAVRGFRIWTDVFLIEVLDPETFMPVQEGAVGTLVVTPLWTSNVTPFLRWSSGDLVTLTRGDDDSGPFSVFPLVKHAHRTSGFFKIRGVNINHADFEDFIFRNVEIGDFKAEAVTERDLDVLLVSVEVHRGVDAKAAADALQSAVRNQFGLMPQIVVVETGALAREFEASVKMPRFSDRRN
jgi:phenylacetate-CoA ligase